MRGVFFTNQELGALISNAKPSHHSAAYNSAVKKLLQASNPLEQAKKPKTNATKRAAPCQPKKKTQRKPPSQPPKPAWMQTSQWP